MVFVFVAFGMLVTKNIFRNVKVLPVTSIVKFDHEKHVFWYYAMVVYQGLNVIFAGLCEFAINLYLYYIIICIEFTINLLGARLRRFGHDKFEELTANQSAKDHKAIVDLINYHIGVGK